MTTIEFRSDNSAGVAPEILAAIAEANVGSTIAYGADATTSRLEHRIREVFEHDAAPRLPRHQRNGGQRTGADGPDPTVGCGDLS